MKVPLLGSFFEKQVNELVGIDIGTTTIKLCALKNTKGFFTVQKVVLKTYDQDLLSDGHIVDIDFLANELKGIFEENRIKCRNVACALSSYSVISKKITIPFLQEEELEELSVWKSKMRFHSQCAIFTTVIMLWVLMPKNRV